MFIKDRRNEPGVPLGMLLAGEVFFRDGETDESSYCMKIREIEGRDGRKVNTVRLGSGKTLCLPEDRLVQRIQATLVVENSEEADESEEKTERYIAELRKNREAYIRELSAALMAAADHLRTEGKRMDLLLWPWLREAAQYVAENRG